MWEWALALAAAVPGTLVIAWGIGVFPLLGGDEGIYVDQAWSASHGHVTPYTYTYDHPFAGWLQLAPLLRTAMALHIGGPLSVVNGRACMVVYAFATLLLVYGIARRLRVRAAYASFGVLLLGLSPLFVTEARQVYLDNIAIPWVLASCWLALTSRRRLPTYALSGLLMAIGVLSKETTALLLPVPIYLLWTHAYRPTRAMSVTVFLSVAGLVVLGYPLFAALRGELLPGPGHVSLWTNGIMYQLASRQGSGALWDPNSSRHALMEGWLQTDAPLLVAGAFAAAVCAGVPRLRPVALGMLMWALPVIKPGGYLPSMYVIAVLPFCALAVAGALDAATSGALGLLRAGNGGGRRRRATGGRASSIVAAGAAAVLAGAVLGRCLPLDEPITFHARDTVTASLQAEKYIEAHASPEDNVVLDNAYWTDIATQGFGHTWRGAISYYQFDLDPISSSKNLPQGWQDINYVIETSAMQDNISNLHLTKLSQVFAHSHVVAAWGEGAEQVQIRQVAATPYNSHGKDHQ